MFTRANECPLPAFVRSWTIADKAEFWPAMVYPLLTQSGHLAVATIGIAAKAYWLRDDRAPSEFMIEIVIAIPHWHRALAKHRAS